MLVLSPDHPAFSSWDRDPHDEFADEVAEARREREADFRIVLTEHFGEAGLDNILSEHVEESCRQAATKGPLHPSTVHRRKQRDIPFLARSILLATFGRSADIPPKAQAYITDCRIDWITATALKSVAKTGGATVSPRTARAITGDVWTVSLQGFEEQYDALDAATVVAYLRRHRWSLFTSDDLYLGAWLERKHRRYCVDLTKLFPDERSAMAFAQDNKQRAITHLATGTTIEVPKRKRRAA